MSEGIPRMPAAIHTGAVGHQGASLETFAASSDISLIAWAPLCSGQVFRFLRGPLEPALQFLLVDAPVAAYPQRPQVAPLDDPIHGARMDPQVRRHLLHREVRAGRQVGFVPPPRLAGLSRLWPSPLAPMRFFVDHKMLISSPDKNAGVLFAR